MNTTQNFTQDSDMDQSKEHIFTVQYEPGKDNLTASVKSRGPLPGVFGTKTKLKNVYATLQLEDGVGKEEKLDFDKDSHIYFSARPDTWLKIRLYAKRSIHQDKCIASTRKTLQVLLNGETPIALVPLDSDLSDKYLRQTPTLALNVAVQRDLPELHTTELEEAFNTSERWNNFASYAGQVAAVVNGVVGGAHPVAGAVLSALKLGSKEICDRIERLDGLLALVKETTEACKLTVEVKGAEYKDRQARQQEACATLLQHIYHTLVLLHSLARKNKWEQTSGHTKKQVEGLRAQLKAYMTSVVEKASVDTQTAIFRIEDIAKDMVNEQRLAQLPYAQDVQSGASKGCLKGTRVGLLQDIEDWAFGVEGPRGFVLYGAAGKGKSAVAHTAATRLKDSGAHTAFFGFDRTSQNIDVAQLFPTLAARLARQSKPYHDYLCGLDVDTLSKRDITEQRAALMDPLCGDASPLTTTLFIVDALDECPAGSDEERRKRGVFLDALSNLMTDRSLPPNVRFLVTTRPGERDIERYLFGPAVSESSAPILSDSLRLFCIDNIGDTNKDIRRYVNAELSKSPVGRTLIDDVVEASQDLFQCAAVLCREVSGPTLVKSRKTLLETVRRSPGRGLYGVYRAVLDSHFGVEDEDVMDVYRRFVRLVLLVQTPQKQGTFAEFDAAVRSLRGEERDDILVQETIRGLGSLLTGTRQDSAEPIRVLHTSFRDYVLDSAESGPFAISLSAASHLEVAEACLHIMNDPRYGLRFNICHLPTSFAINEEFVDLPERVEKHISPGLQYACRATADHLRRALSCSLAHSDERTMQISSAVTNFMENNFLFWLEACSCMRLDWVAPQELQNYLSYVTECKMENLQVLVEDFIKFELRFREGFMRSAPQVYISALLLSPRLSTTSQLYRARFAHFVGMTRPAFMDHWPVGEPRVVTTLGSVVSVGYSPNGKWIAAGLRSGTIQLWDSRTFSPLFNDRQGFSGHQDAVSSLAFSTDGTRIVSGSHDQTIRVWDTQTGTQVGDALQGHDNPVCSVAFSPGGTHIVSGSEDQTVRIWDARTGRQVGDALQGHDHSVCSVAFSPDGTRIVSGSEDQTVRIWDAQTGTQVGDPLQGHNDWVSSVAFSPNGTYIVSGSDDQTIRIWDAHTGTQVGDALQGHDDDVNCVAFSPDGTLIVSGSDDQTVRIWDTQTGTQVGEALQGHSSYVNCVAFAPDGACIVSGSNDYTFRVWDTHTGIQGGEALQGHDRSVISVAFSPDGTHIASGSEDQTLRIWDSQTGMQVGEALQGHAGYVCAVTFSPDGTRIVSGSDDQTVCIWDTQTGTQVGDPLQGHSDYISSLAFSPNGIHIVSGSNDQTIRIWDAQTGTQVGDPLHGHGDSVCSVAFSPDGTRIVSGSDDQTVRIWDVQTGAQIGEALQGHDRGVNCVTFSPDGTRIVSGSDDKTVRIWDMHTGTQVGDALQGHDRSVISVAFSQDGTRIVSASYENTVRIWDAQTGTQVGVATQGLDGDVNCVAFSPDGTHTVSGSDDSTVHMWLTNQFVGIGSPPKCLSTCQDVFQSLDDGSPFESNEQSSISGLDHSSVQASLALALHKIDDWLCAQIGDATVPILWLPPQLDSLPLVFSPRHLRVLSRSPSITIDTRCAALGARWTEMYIGGCSTAQDNKI